MPQLNPLDWGPQLVWLLLTFGVLYLLMVYVALPRIGSVIEARAARIAADLATEGAEAEARIDKAKASAMKDVSAVAADVATDIVRRLIGVAPAKAEVDKAVGAARKE
jgi:F-type H+-transporting ATPase subunit b